ncbi:MAG: asparagine synthase-related protein [Chloroflexota bacterium]|nr:asparagine synthase-related protein [Chloroflexota bacterium]
MIQKDPTKVLILGNEPRVALRDESPQRTVVLYGSPTLNGEPVTEIGSLGKLGEKSQNPTNLVKSLNGEFVLLIETPDQLVLANDRFAALPIFYAIDTASLVVSFSYQQIWRWLSQNSRLKIDSLAFYEFLHFQRLFGTTTFDQTSNVLTPATVLTIDKRSKNPSTARYWKPNFDKRHDGRNAIASDLADAIKNTVALKTNDAAHTTLLLSGGMDSRAALGGFTPDALPNCVTIGASENNEVDVARAVSATAGAPHTFVQRPATHYADILPQAVADGGGMYTFHHGHFYGLDIPDTDLILHGHGFDYFFQGMYLPSKRRSLVGQPTRTWALEPIGFDLTGEYIAKAKYRLKGIDTVDLLDANVANDATGRLRADLDSVLKNINGETSEPYDDWDYLTTSAPGRHYTYLNLLSAASLAEQRTIAFDNDILDIYYSIPAKMRHGTRLLAETIKILNPKLLEVRNANTNLRPDLSPTRLTIDSWMRGAKRRVGIGRIATSDPSDKDRSWPSEDGVLRNSPALQERLTDLRKSQNLDSLNIFDTAKINQLIDSFEAGNNSPATALLTLITIDEFISSSS